MHGKNTVKYVETNIILFQTCYEDFVIPPSSTPHTSLRQEVPAMSSMQPAVQAHDDAAAAAATTGQKVDRLTGRALWCRRPGLPGTRASPSEGRGHRPGSPRPSPAAAPPAGPFREPRRRHTITRFVKITVLLKCTLTE